MQDRIEEDHPFLFIFYFLIKELVWLQIFSWNSIAMDLQLIYLHKKWKKRTAVLAQYGSQLEHENLSGLFFVGHS